MNPFVCFSTVQIEDRAMLIACVTIFVYVVVHGVWKALDKKFNRCEKCGGNDLALEVDYGGTWYRCRKCQPVAR